jgi:exonuclease III
MTKNNIKLAAIQETKWGPKNNPKVNGFSIIREDRQQNQGGGLAFIISKDISYNIVRNTIQDDHTEHQAPDIHTNERSLRIHNIYIPPSSSCGTFFKPNIISILEEDDFLILGDISMPIIHSGTIRQRTNSQTVHYYPRRV